MEATTVFTIGLLTAIVYLVMKAFKRNQYWRDQGVRQYKPLPFFGNMLPVILRRQTIGELFMEICKALPNEKVIGFYFFMKPMLVINDIELVERVFIKDFPHFSDRGPQPDITRGPQEVMQMSLFNTNGNLWRAIRSKLSPMFTTGKLRVMFPQIVGIGDSFMDLLKKKADKIDMTDYFGKFAMEIIGATAFGFEGRAMEENSEFRKMGKKILEPSLENFVKFTIAPSLLDKFGLKTIPSATMDYFGTAIKNTLKYKALPWLSGLRRRSEIARFMGIRGSIPRLGTKFARRETGVVRHDFIQHMLTLQQKGSIEVEKADASDEILMLDHVPEMKVEMSDELMIGQSLGFMSAGFDATALSMGWLCYEIARNPEIQSKIREEAKEVLSKHGNRLDYDTAREMKYLMSCLKENGRLHSVLHSNFRMVAKTYKVPGTSAVLKPGDYVYIPVLNIHMNPKFYPEPEKFLPERWGPDNDRSSCTYLPFGAGPRMCIAMRFAYMEMICAIAKLVINFEIALHHSVKLPPRIEPYSFFTYPRKKIHYNLKKISV